MLRKIPSGLVLTALLFSMFPFTFESQPIRSEPTTWTVDDDGPADFHTIQEAVNTATDGDTIFVFSGTYKEWISIDKHVTLIGENRNTTIVKGPYSPDQVGTVIDVRANNTSLRGFTIQDGAVGIHLYSCNNTLEDNILTLNKNVALYADFNSGFNTIKNNLVSLSGQGILVGGCDKNVIIGNTVYNNTKGMDIERSTGNSLKNNNLVDNKYNFYFIGSTLQHFINDIDTSNLVDGKPIYYWINQHDKEVPTDAGCVVIVNSTDVVVKDLNLTRNGIGVLFAHTTGSIIENVYSSKNVYSMWLQASRTNIVRDSTITLNRYSGILLEGSTNNSITNNTLLDNANGIRIHDDSNNNSLVANRILNSWQGIDLMRSSDNTLKNNNLTNSCMLLWYSSTHNTFSGNVVSSNSYCVRIEDSGWNTFTDNKMTGNGINFGVYGGSYGHFIQNVDDSNSVNGRPICYWLNQRDKQIPSDAGYVAVVNSTNITVKNLNLTHNGQGVLFALTNNSTIENVTISRNEFGIYLWQSGDNFVMSNTIESNQPLVPFGWTSGICLMSSNNNTITNNMVASNHDGVRMYSSSDNTISENTISHSNCGILLSLSSNNIIFHNNFVNNSDQVGHYQSSNTWDADYPYGGNYWSDYEKRYPLAEDACSGPHQNQTGNDGIWDHPYFIDKNDQDKYPLMNMYYSLLGDLNKDRTVNILDIVIVAIAFGSASADPDWNQIADLNNDKIINILDISTVAMEFGRTV